MKRIVYRDGWGTPSSELVAEVDDLDAQLTVMDAIPCSSVPSARVAAALRPHTLVDARMCKRKVPEDLRALTPVVVGLGPALRPAATHAGC